MIEDCNKSTSIKKLKNTNKEMNDLLEFPSENPNPVLRVNTDYRIIYANKPAKVLLAGLGLKGKKIPEKLINSVKASQQKKDDHSMTLELKIGMKLYELSIIKIKNKDYYNIYGYDVTKRRKSEKNEQKIKKDKILLNERNYMARELHDTVTQTLFSSNLIAEVLPKLWKKDPGSVIKRLKEIRMLNNLALTEIRALLYDLRPSSFKNEDLGEHLKDLVKSMGIKTKIPISVEIEKKYGYSHRIEVSFYRIAQEALNNIVKHSSANKAKLVLKSLSSKITLNICDDGIGFDTQNSYSESLGVIIMKERAKMIGAFLEIKSSPGKGTRILLSYHNTKRSDNDYA
jgi:signal transduction histidine kinase